MTYDVVLTPTAETDLRRLDSAIARRVIEKLKWLADNIETIRLETLTDSWSGVFKLRIGHYHVLYTREAAKQQIVVHFIRHRRDVYKKARD